jgi:hypothetical protein
MPTPSRWLIRAALIWLLGGLILGVAMQLPASPRLPLLGVLWPAYLHSLTVGWLTQLIIGVALWLFPRHSAARPRGSDALGWTAFACLNFGLVLRVLGEPQRALGTDVGPVLLLSALAQLVAVIAFVVNIWPRVKMR